MDYHIPAPQWAIFGLPDFETYKQKLVVKGLFHSAVPKDVIESYEVAEYMMAHAYYHYPLYDEALSKLLRIIEMAVKIRCRQVDIPLITTTIQKKTQKQIYTDKKFKTLIDELSEAIDIGDIVDQLHRLREVRNSRMHQASHSYTGAMFFQVIKSSVTVLNKLFLQQLISDSDQQRLLSISKTITQFDNGFFILEKSGKKYLIRGLQIVESLFIKSSWFHLLVFFPVSNNFSEQMKEHKYMPLFFDTVTDLQIDKGVLSAKSLQEDISIIQVTTTNNDLDMLQFVSFQIETQKVSNADRQLYDAWAHFEINDNKIDFVYQQMWKSV